MRRILPILIAGSLILILPGVARAAPRDVLVRPVTRTPSTTASPTLTLADPANGALISGGQPVFRGSARGVGAGPVTVTVYAGTSAGGVPVEVVSATPSDGAYSATAQSLPDGTYTAQATATDTAGQAVSSPTVTFQLFNGAPGLTLQAPPAPVVTPQPTFTGTGVTAPGAAGTVTLAVYPGPSTDATPVSILSGTLAADGTFSIQVSPGLVPGLYTVVAGQDTVAGPTFSAPVTVKIVRATTALTILAPAPHAAEPQSGVVIRGRAADAPADSPDLELTLFRGIHAAGPPVDRLRVTRTGAKWNVRWPHALALGTYTLRVVQAVSAGADLVSTRTFVVAAPGQLHGEVAVSARGVISAQLRCLAGAGACTGDVLIVSQRPMQARRGGPVGRLSLMFLRYSVRGGHTVTLRSRLDGGQLAALRRAGASRLIATVVYFLAGALHETSHLTAPVRVG